MLNRITIMGRMTKDPELRRTESGLSVTSFTVAVDRDFSGKDGSDKETDFIDCVAWRQTADFVSKYFTKGRMIVVSGRLQIRSWTDKEDNKRRSAEVVADNVYFGDSKKDESQPQIQPQYGAPQQGYPSFGGYQNPSQTASQFTQGGFGGYQQPAYPQQGYQSPFPQQGSFQPMEGDDPNLLF